MKNLLAIAILASFSFAANAGTKFAEYPRVGGYPVNELCDAGANFQTTMPRRHCATWDTTTSPIQDVYHGNDVKCLQWENKVMLISKEIHVQGCPGSFQPRDAQADKCVANVQSIRLLGNTYEVPVMEDRGELGLFEVSRFEYTITPCN